jgi:hypothetical protein
MDVIFLSFKLDQIGFEVTSNVGEDIYHPIENVRCKYTFAVLGNKDQVAVHIEYAMPAASNFCVVKFLLT